MYYDKLIEAQYKALGLPNPINSNRRMSDFEYLDFMINMSSEEFEYLVEANLDEKSYNVKYTFYEDNPIKLTFTQSQIQSMKSIASPNTRIENLLDMTDNIGKRALKENLQEK